MVMLQSRKIVPPLPAVEAYHRGLKVLFLFGLLKCMIDYSTEIFKFTCLFISIGSFPLGTGFENLGFCNYTFIVAEPMCFGKG